MEVQLSVNPPASMLCKEATEMPAPVQLTDTMVVPIDQAAAAGLAKELTLNCDEGEVAEPLETQPADDA